MSSLSYYPVGASSDCRAGEPPIDCKLSEKSVSPFDSRTSSFISVSSRCRTLRVRVRLYSGEEIERERESVR